MTTNFASGSAKIYQFPATIRGSVGGGRGETNPAADFASLRIAKTAFGSGWYHEEAIEEAERAGKK
jgi:hypothetical protein